jgi:hypothetical protein
LGEGADVNVQGGKYGNLLYTAAEGGYQKVIKLLLDKGSDVNAQGCLTDHTTYTTEDLGLILRVVRKAATILKVASISKQNNTLDLILHVRVQFLDRFVDDSTSLTIRELSVSNQPATGIIERIEQFLAVVTYLYPPATIFASGHLALHLLNTSTTAWNFVIGTRCQPVDSVLRSKWA